MSADFSLDDFPCGLVVTTVEEQQIIFANQLFYAVSQYEPNGVAKIGHLFTPASKIMVESFIMPMLLHQGFCEEIQLTMQTKNSERIPVLVNAKVVTRDSRYIYWVISKAEQRDSLYQELVNLRNDLEVRAEKLEILSQTDELTRLLNRRAFIAKANEVIRLAQRHRMTYSFFMLDIDHFKQINDNYGHDIGDKVLRNIAQLLNKNSREHDILARIGGEEFAIITMDSPDNSPAQFANKLLSIIRSQKIQEIEVTLSIGVVTSACANFAHLYKEADILLYQAKDRGRNQVVSRFLDWVNQ